MNSKKIFMIFTIVFVAALVATSAYSYDDSTRNILKQGLLGAGTGAIASGASGGNAGTGALIGAGTNVIGGALLDMLTTPSAPARPIRRPPATRPSRTAIHFYQLVRRHLALYCALPGCFDYTSSCVCCTPPTGIWANPCIISSVLTSTSTSWTGCSTPSPPNRPTRC